MSIASTKKSSSGNIKQLRVYLNLLGEDPTDVVLHVWNDTDAKNYFGVDAKDDVGIPIDGIVPEYGVYWDLPIYDTKTGKINVRPLRDGRELLPKSAEIDMGKLTQSNYQIFSFKGKSKIYYEPLQAPPLDFNGALAHWISVDTLLMPGDINKVELYHSAIGRIKVYADKIEGFDNKFEAVSFDGPLTKDTEAWRARFPHLHYLKAWKLQLNAEFAKSLLKGQLVVLAKDQNNNIRYVTHVQIANLLDKLYVQHGEADSKSLHYGATVLKDKTEFRVWAPTAQAVSLVGFDAHKKQRIELSMQFESASGSWFLATSKLTHGDFYRYKIEVYHPAANEIKNYEVTDPYSKSLSTDSLYSQVVNLSSPELKPLQWDSLKSPRSQKNPAEMLIYEAHIRDLTAQDKTVTASHRGKFIALTETTSRPVQHLKELSEHGVTHLHLLPLFDVATIHENQHELVDIHQPFSHLARLRPELLNGEFAKYCQSQLSIAEVFAALKPEDRPDNPVIQRLNLLIADIDSFNWGYDPFHYSVPEGSYSTNADGMKRIREFRDMVKSIKQYIGMNVIMDMVYNHTFASGPDSKHSVLDKIVPWYYHRLNVQSGKVETSTCCDNTASEHAMMARLIRDSLVMWAKEYKIDAFRFDLMGHHPKAQIVDALKAVREVNPEAYFYGEGWNFGEVTNNARFIQATQANMAGTGIGTFSDRLRNAVRGGSAFDFGDALRFHQGFGNGAFVLPNEFNAVHLGEALHYADVVRIGMAGNLKDFSFITHTGERKLGEQIYYKDQPVGYAQDPIEVQNYVSKHDNQTLWDNNQYKVPFATSIETRVRMHAISIATAILGQGIPFTHQGVELLRSKSMERDSYNSGDWYNRVDYSLQDNNWNKGLPRKDKDGHNFGIIQRVLDGHGANAKPKPENIQAMVSYYKELASLRAYYPLLTLGTGKEVKKRIDFMNVGHGQIPSLILMTIDNGINSGCDLDKRIDGIIVIINASPNEHHFDTGIEQLRLSPLHKTNLKANAKVKGSTVIIPAWTPLVLELPRGTVRGKGIPVNQ